MNAAALLVNLLWLEIRKGMIGYDHASLYPPWGSEQRLTVRCITLTPPV
jgi:hypothetical protein